MMTCLPSSGGFVDIEVESAWAATTGTKAVRVAVVDSGIDHGHPDLGGNVWSNACEGTLGDGDTPCLGRTLGNGFPDDVHGYNFIDDVPNAVDTSASAHGNMVAGVIGAVTNNDVGVAGVNWHVSLMALKFTRESKGLVADAAEAIRYAVLERAHVINASFSTEGDDIHLRAAIEAAKLAGILVVAAAATDDGAEENLDDFGGYPCVYDLANVLCVTAVDESHALASSWGATTVDLGAPGVAIYSAFTSPLHRKQSGTSMAAPFVSGVAALILSKCPGLDLAQLRTRLLTGLPFSSPPGRSTVTGKRVNAKLALAASCGPGPPGHPTLLEP